MRLLKLWRTVSVRSYHPSAVTRPFVMVFTCGLPGSGKTRVLDRLYGLGNVVVLDLDQEMKRHGRFDPSAPTKLYDDAEAYQWADAAVEAKFQRLLQEKQPLVAVDGTGTKVARTRRRMRAAKEAGYFTRLLHVDVSLETAVERNRRRRRQVPLEVLADYQTKLKVALEATKDEVDEFIYVSNEDDDGLTGLKRWGSLYSKYYAEYSLPPDDMGHTIGDPKAKLDKEYWKEVLKHSSFDDAAEEQTESPSVSNSDAKGSKSS